MIIWDELYKDFLFRTEDEYILFGLLIPNMFWDKTNDIENHYKSLFKTKIETTLQNSLERITKENSKLRFEDYMIRFFENSLEYSFEENLRYASLPIEEIAEIIVRNFSNKIEEFSNRLKILQSEKNILDYYSSMDALEIISEEEFPKQIELMNLDFNFSDITNLAYFL